MQALNGHASSQRSCKLTAVMLTHSSHADSQRSCRLTTVMLTHDGHADSQLSCRLTTVMLTHNGHADSQRSCKLTTFEFASTHANYKSRATREHLASITTRHTSGEFCTRVLGHRSHAEGKDCVQDICIGVQSNDSEMKVDGDNVCISKHSSRLHTNRWNRYLCSQKDLDGTAVPVYRSSPKRSMRGSPRIQRSVALQ